MHRDLGHLDGPVLLFGGPYSNLQATQALFVVVDQRGIAPDHVICTGDVVAYCGDPVATVDLVRGRGCAVVAGNCEIQLGAGADGCGCGFAPGSTCDLLSAGWYAHAGAALNDDARSWMRDCPTVLSFHHQGARYAVIHGGHRDVARFIWPTDSDDVFSEEWKSIEADIGPVDRVIAGHCGIPFLRDTDRGQWINAGVIGMPPNDGSQDTRFAVLDGGDVTVHRLRYDVSSALRAMDAAGLTQGYNRGLTSGYWPSEDVLPVSLRSRSWASG